MNKRTVSALFILCSLASVRLYAGRIRVYNKTRDPIIVKIYDKKGVELASEILPSGRKRLLYKPLATIAKITWKNMRYSERTPSIHSRGSGDGTTYAFSTAISATSIGHELIIHEFGKVEYIKNKNNHLEGLTQQQEER